MEMLIQRALYNRMSFEVIRESAVYGNGSFSVYGSRVKVLAQEALSA
jgi:hypothetical protein